MLERADAGRAVADLAGPRFRQRDELLHRAHRHRRMHDQHAHQPRDRRYPDEILQRVIRQLLVEVRVGDERRRIDHHRVAVGRALRDERGADRSARARRGCRSRTAGSSARRLSGTRSGRRCRSRRRGKHDHDAHRLRRDIPAPTPRRTRARSKRRTLGQIEPHSCRPPLGSNYRLVPSHAVTQSPVTLSSPARDPRP